MVKLKNWEPHPAISAIENRKAITREKAIECFSKLRQQALDVIERET